MPTINREELIILPKMLQGEKKRSNSFLMTDITSK